MADIAQLEQGLIKAHQAGNAEHAKIFADEIRKMRAQPQAEVQPEQQEPQRQPTLLERFKSSMAEKALSLAKTGIGAVDFSQGVGRGLRDPIDTGADVLSNLGGADENARITALNEAEKAKFQAQYGDNAPAQAGRVAGNVVATAPVGGVLAKGVTAVGSRVAPTITPMVANALRSGGMTTGAPAAKALSIEGARNAAIRVGGGAATGAAMGGLINPEDADTAAVIGGAIPIVGKLGGESGRLINRLIVDPLFRPNRAAIEKLVQDAGGVKQAKAAIEKAIAAGKTLSGESYTLGQAGKNAGLAATERANSAVRPENFQQIYQAQRDARVKALQGIGKDDVALQNAITSRDDAANSLYGKAFTSDAMRTDIAKQDIANRALTSSGGIHQGINTAVKNLSEDLSTPGIQELIKRPAFASAAKQAKILASNKGLDIGDPTQSLQGLHYIKLALDDALQPNATTPLGRNASASIMDMRDKLATELETLAPLYGQAKSVYADMSKPINQMKLGQRFTDVLTGEAYKSGANAKQQAEQFFRARKNAPSIIKQETGVRQPLNKVFNEGQIKTIDQVRKELAKDVDLQNLGKGVGSDTAQKAARANMMNSLADLINSNKVARASANLATLGAKGRVNNQLDKLLQSPEYAGKTFDEFTKVQKNKLAELLANPTVRALPIAAQSR